MNQPQRIAVYPGSFDPIHQGHVDIIERMAPVFDRVIILIAQSSQKQSLFSVEERKKMIEQTLQHVKNVEVDTFAGLTVDYMKQKNAQIIVRGLRAVVDFEYEMTMASMNKKLAPQIETMLVFSKPEFYYISSRGVQEVAINGGNLDGLVPEDVARLLNLKIKTQ